MPNITLGILCLVMTAVANFATAETSATSQLPALDLIPIESLESRVDELLYHMSNDEKAAQLIMVYFSGEEFVTEHQFGGVLVMQNMLKNPTKITAELKTLQDSSASGVFVAIDQEGGVVNRIKRLPGWSKTPSAKIMREWDTAKITELTSRVGAQLNEIGLNMNLAPVVDPAIDYLGRDTFMEKSRRSFGDKGAEIIPDARAFIKGFNQHGVLTINKHFPGYDVATNSDHDIAVSQAPFENILNNTSSFSALSSDADGVMMSSILFEDTDDKPAVVSHMMVGWARALYGDGIIITDDLWGVALRSWVNPKASIKNYPDEDFLKLVRMALLAGNDMLMITYPEKAVLMKEAIAEWMMADELVAYRVNESARRILTLKLTKLTPTPQIKPQFQPAP